MVAYKAAQKSGNTALKKELWDKYRCAAYATKDRLRAVGTSAPYACS